MMGDRWVAGFGMAASGRGCRHLDARRGFVDRKAPRQWVTAQRRVVVHACVEGGSAHEGSPELAEHKLAQSLRKIFTVQQIDKDAAKLGIPAVGTIALEPLISLVDTALIGRLGAGAIASVAVGKGAFSLFFMPMNFLGIATLPRIAACSKEPAKASRMIASTLWIALMVGVVIATFLGLNAPAICTKLGATAVLLPDTVTYLRWRLTTAPLYLMSMVTVATFRAFQDTLTPFYIALVADATNIVLHVVLMFGLGLNIAGAGMAVAGTQAVFTGTMLWVMIRRRWMELADLAHLPSAQYLASLVRDGVALTCRSFAIHAVVNLANVVASARGTSVLAAFEVQRQVWGLVGRVLDGVSVAAQSLVPRAVASGDLKLARSTASRLMQLAFFGGLINGLSMFLAAPTIASLFSSDPSTQAAIARAFPAMAMFLPVTAVSFVLEGVFSSRRRFGTLSASIVVSAAVSWTLLAYLRRHTDLGLSFIWVALNTMLVIRMVILGVIYRSRLTPIPVAADNAGGAQKEG